MKKLINLKRSAFESINHFELSNPENKGQYCRVTSVTDDTFSSSQRGNDIILKIWFPGLCTIPRLIMLFHYLGHFLCCEASEASNAFLDFEEFHESVQSLQYSHSFLTKLDHSDGNVTHSPQMKTSSDETRRMKPSSYHSEKKSQNYCLSSKFNAEIMSFLTWKRAWIPIFGVSEHGCTSFSVSLSNRKTQEQTLFFRITIYAATMPQGS